ncbi:MAG: hypothetical protein HYY65_05500 [Candidatus Tectomicrobia bacterium]|uniref:Uncharacterized protein n=1 Tax=Tectimicrobiota bacterium TaxID=2528274 RepID=A0A932M036_UNCTE|nr:hypothetical protein [Candidatus Tectomicrobia bacterium]
MTVEYFTLYPTCDVHLLTYGSPMKLKLLATVSQKTTVDGAEETDYSTENYANHADTEVHVENAAVVSAEKKADAGGYIQLAPVGVGTSMVRIRHVDRSGSEPAAHEILVRVKVHTAIRELWLGNNQITIQIFEKYIPSSGEGGESDYRATVYARFDDDSIGDVTSHPYLEFSSGAPGVVNVNNLTDKGRLVARALAEPIDTPETPDAGGLMLEVKYGGLEDRIRVYSIDRMTTRSLVELVHGSGDVNERRNILFLSEGFGESDRSLFDNLVLLLTDRLFYSPGNSPFQHLKDRFNVWKAFDPSPERGISVGIPVSSTGTPWRYVSGLTDDVPLLQVKDTVFGLMYGLRHGDRVSTRLFSEAEQLDPEGWYTPQAEMKSIREDRRRMPQEWDSGGFLTKYLNSLANNPARSNGVTITPGQLWAAGTEDRRLVCLLVNDNRRGGTSSGSSVKVTLGDGRFANLQETGKGAGLDHEPEEMTIELAGGRFTKKGIHIDRVASTLAHELGHALHLGDEYEAEGHSFRYELQEKDKPSQETIEGMTNVTHHYILQDPGDPELIDIDKVKWSEWKRIGLSAPLKDAPSAVSSDEMEITLDTDRTTTWDSLASQSGSAYLRKRDINYRFDGSGELEGDFYDIGPLQLQPGASPGSYRLKRQDGTLDFMDYKIEAGDVLYVPMTEQQGGEEVILMVIPSEVYEHLKQKGEPFGWKKDPSEENYGETKPKGIKRKLRKPSTIGVYDGGGEFNHKAYRPGGTCRMRDSSVSNVSGTTPVDFTVFTGDVEESVQPVQYVPFCFACKYALVNEVDPDKLGDLDGEHPSSGERWMLFSE